MAIKKHVCAWGALCDSPHDITPDEVQEVVGKIWMYGERTPAYARRRARELEDLGARREAELYRRAARELEI